MIILIAIGFMILSFAVSRRLKNKFRKYSQIQLSSGLSGKEVAEQMLADNGIRNVKVTSVSGNLTDHYNPSNKTVNLSENVYYGKSAAAAAIAAHECGHAVQHAKAYAPLEFRSAMVPVQNASAKILNFVVLMSIFGGFFFLNINFDMILMIIIGCYSIITLFSLVTLPVEFDASRRGLAWVTDRGIVNSKEKDMAKDALKWAAMTYLVAAIGSLVTLLYFIIAFMGGNE